MEGKGERKTFETTRRHKGLGRWKKLQTKGYKKGKLWFWHSSLPWGVPRHTMGREEIVPNAFNFSLSFFVAIPVSSPYHVWEDSLVVPRIPETRLLGIEKVIRVRNGRPIVRGAHRRTRLEVFRWKACRPGVLCSMIFLQLAGSFTPYTTIQYSCLRLLFSRSFSVSLVLCCSPLQSHSPKWKRWDWNIIIPGSMAIQRDEVNSVHLTPY